MDLSDGSKDLELAGSPWRPVPVLPFVQVNVVVMELQEPGSTILIIACICVTFKPSRFKGIETSKGSYDLGLFA